MSQYHQLDSERILTLNSNNQKVLRVDIIDEHFELYLLFRKILIDGYSKLERLKKIIKVCFMKDVNKCI